MNQLLPLLAEESLHTRFEWGRIQSNSDWALPILITIAVLLWVRWMYRRDAVELHPIWSWMLTALRTAAFLALLFFYLQPTWRIDREIVRPSRALLLVDTSLSMGLNDVDTAEKSASSAKTGSRLNQIVSTFKETNLLGQLRKTHDVSIYAFNDDLLADRVITLPKHSANDAASSEEDITDASKSKQDSDKEKNTSPDEKPDSSDENDATTNENNTAADENGTAKKPDEAWVSLLTPGGSETRLGQALRQLIYLERNAPLSAVILFSDGGQNAGIAPDAAVNLAEDLHLPIYTVGLGSDRQPSNVRVSDLTAPARAYPGDKYTVTGYLQAQHLGGRSVTVELLSRPSGSSVKEEETGTKIDERQIVLGEDGEAVPVSFEITPRDTGRTTLCLRVVAPSEDHNATDDFREADIEIVDRKNRVLLFAGGPMRDYQFLRTLLYRDRSTALDVLLQSGKEGMSQEGNILSHFPNSREEMFQYDCVVAFDPDWQALKSEQIALMENWVAEQGGGLIAVAGPVYAARSVAGWTQDAAMAPIRNLYPVEFPRRFAGLESNAYTTDEAVPLEFTREGLEADFLWLGDSASSGRQAWTSFPGVYSFCPLRGAKPGATVYARFFDAKLGKPEELPVYFAGQFYGSGSVFYLGSGEMWRLRSQEEKYFEQFYTKLIRHVSQGRLLRGSSRGVLLTGQDRYLLGNAVEVRAQLSDARLEPLTAASVPLQVFAPNGNVRTIALKPDAARSGTFVGQFPAMLEGSYRLELVVPESDSERLLRRVQVKVPELERENPRRNDPLLEGIALKTRARYYKGLNSVFDEDAPLADQLKDRTTTLVQTDAPSPIWEEAWMKWFMIALCGILCIEWTARRLLKLA